MFDLTETSGDLRGLMEHGELIRVPGCFDALSAKILQDMGFGCAFLSGFGVSAARLGLPDTGLLSFYEMLDTLRSCSASAPELAIIADGDTGYGNSINVQRTVFEYIKAGAAAVTIEDQVNPKRCGHTQGKQVISRGDARMNIRAAVSARGSSRSLVVARTDARSVLGAEEALDRCMMFEDEGADIIFLEGPQTIGEMETLCRRVKTPKMINTLANGKTPVLSFRELENMGYGLAICPVDLLSAAVSAMRLAAKAIGETDAVPPPAMLFSDLQNAVGFPEYWEKEKQFKTDGTDR